MTKHKITAVLGPTNTGKTHLAIETMLSFNSGMIGFPLRLLANNLKGKPIMPELNESIVSIARCVFPVFVGPRTAVILCFVISTFGVLFFLPTRYCWC